jgi:hypothetical protein
MPWPRSAGCPRDSAPRRAFLQLSQASARAVEPGPRRFGDTYAESRAVFVAESNRRPRVVFELCPRRIFGEIGRGACSNCIGCTQITIGNFRRRIRPSASAIREQKQWSSAPPRCASRTELYSPINCSRRILPVGPTPAFWRSPPVPGLIAKDSKVKGFERRPFATVEARRRRSRIWRVVGQRLVHCQPRLEAIAAPQRRREEL